MSVLESRDPYEVLTQQQLGIEECRKFACESWTYLEKESDIIRTIWNLGSWLQPATEGLTRLYPEYAELAGYGLERKATHGIQAYETWMRTSCGVKQSHNMALLFAPPVRSEQRLAHGLAIGRFFINNVTITSEVRDLPLTDKSLHLPGGLLTLKNTYGEEINGGVYEAVRKEFSDELCETGSSVEDVLIYSPFERLSRNERMLLGDLARERFGEEAAQAYDMFGKSGLIQYRLWSALRSIFQDLPTLTS